MISIQSADVEKITVRMQEKEKFAAMLLKMSIFRSVPICKI